MSSFCGRPTGDHQALGERAAVTEAAFGEAADDGGADDEAVGVASVGSGRG